jgi:membrane protease YdiL (CAAX protease family)
MENSPRQLLRDLGREPTVLLCGAATVLVLGHYQGSGAFFRRTFGAAMAGHPAAGALPYLWWFGASVVLYMLVPLLLSRLARLPAHGRYGLGLGDWRAGVRLSALLLAVMLPLVGVAAHTATFGHHYPLARLHAYTLQAEGGAQVSPGLFALYEAAYLAYFIAWEFLFRGWLLQGLRPRLGAGPSILVQTLPFVLMHLGKPELEALGAVPAGVALGVLALRTGSFWYGALVHGVVAVRMDVLAALPYLRAP